VLNTSISCSTKDEVVQVHLSNSEDQSLTNADVQKLVIKVEDMLDRPGLFDYQTSMESVLRACSRVLGSLCPQLKNLPSLLSECKAVAITPSGADFMVQFEVSFQADYADKKLAYPNPDSLTEAHLQYIMDEYQHGRKVRGRLRRDAYFWCFDRVCHEVTHLVQAIAEQKDKNPQGWSSEHDASIGAYSLLWAIAQDPENKALFPAGFADEVLAKTMGDDVAAMAKWTAGEKEQYELWRDAFGLKAPSAAISERNSLVSSFCGVLGVESFTEDRKQLASLFSLLFSSQRKGDIYAVKVERPKGLYTSPTTLLAPVKNSSLRSDE